LKEEKAKLKLTQKLQETMEERRLMNYEKYLDIWD
jgi:hypothetical protein